MSNDVDAVELFLEVCQFQKWKACKIPELNKRTPDYFVRNLSGHFFAEIKQLNVVGYKIDQVYGFKPGDKVRKSIGEAKGQLQGYNAPTMLIMCDVHRVGFTRFESMVAGMYGDKTILIDKKTGHTGDMFYGRNSKMREKQNTSISAIADICYDCKDRASLKPYINIYHNMYAKNPFKRDFFIDGDGVSQYWFKAEEVPASSCLRNKKEMERMTVK